MNLKNVWKLAKSDYIKLLPILALAFYMAFIPHLDYPYAIHVDEWEHIARSNALLRITSINYSEPFSGQQETNRMISQLELGYHLPLASFQQLSGISLIGISRYFPSIIFVVTVLSVYVFTKRMGFGWEAAFFTCLIPSTPGILGPAFMIPVALGLIFLPLLLFLVFNFRNAWSYLVIFTFIYFLIVLHAPSAILMIVILVLFLLLSLWGDLKHCLLIMLALVVPLLITLPWTYDIILSERNALFVAKPLPDYIDLLKIISDYGSLPIAFCLLGVFTLASGNTRKNYSLVACLLVLSTMLAIFYTLHYGIAILYIRGLLFLMLMMGIIAGAGLMALRKLELPWSPRPTLKKSLLIRSAGILLSLIVIGATLAITLPDRQAIPYYHMIDNTDYEAFVWIKDNVDSNHQKVILDPWKATAFTAITGKYVYTRIHMTPEATDEQAYEFIRSGSTNTSFLRENGISLIYTRVYDGDGNGEYNTRNPDLIEMRRNVYLLKEPTAK